MRFFLCLILWAILLMPIGICEVPSPSPSPTPTSDIKPPSNLEGLVWNKWDSDHYVIVSLNKSFGEGLLAQIDELRSHGLGFWSIDFRPSKPCKIIVVTDPPMLKKLFGLSNPKCEDQGSEVAIWIDESRVNLISSLILEAELSRVGLRAFASEGISFLNQNSRSIKSKISPIISSQSASEIFSKDKKDYSEEEKRNASILCLMIRKELGSRIFSMASQESAKPIHEVLGFATTKELDATFDRYRSNLLEDIRFDRTPDKYLSVRPR